MAKTISEEELQLRKRARRRLIGAIALVTVVAVVLPMVLDNEPKPINQDITIQIPSHNSGAFTSKIVPAVPSATGGKSAPAPKPEPPQPAVAAPAEKPTAVAAVTPANDTKAAPDKPAPASPRVKEVSKQSPKPAAKTKPETKAKAEPTPVQEIKAVPEAKPKAEPAAAGQAFVVQVAALNDAGKAKQMQEQLAASGMASYTEVVPTKKGNVTRVRAGPFATRGEAEKVRDKLKGMGLNGNVVPK